MSTTTHDSENCDAVNYCEECETLNEIATEFWFWLMIRKGRLPKNVKTCCNHWCPDEQENASSEGKL